MYIPYDPDRSHAINDKTKRKHTYLSNGSRYLLYSAPLAPFAAALWDSISASRASLSPIHTSSFHSLPTFGARRDISFLFLFFLLSAFGFDFLPNGGGLGWTSVLCLRPGFGASKLVCQEAGKCKSIRIVRKRTPPKIGQTFGHLRLAHALHSYYNVGVEREMHVVEFRLRLRS